MIIQEANLEFDFQDTVRKELPLEGAEPWTRPLAGSCHVLNMETWNRNFPKWPVHRINSMDNGLQSV